MGCYGVSHHDKNVEKMATWAMHAVVAIIPLYLLHTVVNLALADAMDMMALGPVVIRPVVALLSFGGLFYCMRQGVASRDRCMLNNSLCCWSYCGFYMTMVVGVMIASAVMSYGIDCCQLCRSFCADLEASMFALNELGNQGKRMGNVASAIASPRAGSAIGGACAGDNRDNHHFAEYCYGDQPCVVTDEQEGACLSDDIKAKQSLATGVDATFSILFFIVTFVGVVSGVQLQKLSQNQAFLGDAVVVCAAPDQDGNALEADP